MSRIIPDIRDAISASDTAFVRNHQIKLEPGCSLDLSAAKYGAGGSSSGFLQVMLVVAGVVVVVAAGCAVYKTHKRTTLSFSE